MHQQRPIPHPAKVVMPLHLHPPRLPRPLLKGVISLHTHPLKVHYQHLPPSINLTNHIVTANQLVRNQHRRIYLHLLITTLLYIRPQHHLLPQFLRKLILRAHMNIAALMLTPHCHYPSTQHPNPIPRPFKIATAALPNMTTGLGLKRSMGVKPRRSNKDRRTRHISISPSVPTPRLIQRGGLYQGRHQNLIQMTLVTV